jgi:hypothetical protein
MTFGSLGYSAFLFYKNRAWGWPGGPKRLISQKGAARQWGMRAGYTGLKLLNIHQNIPFLAVFGG